MSRDKQEKQGIVRQLKAQQEQQEQQPTEEQGVGTELPLEMIVHSSNVAVGRTDDGMVHFMLLTPVGIKFTIPFPLEVWKQICEQSLAPHVEVARGLPPSMR